MNARSIWGCLLILFNLIGGLSPAPLYSQAPLNYSEETLESIEVTATRSSKHPQNISNAVSLIPRDDIQKGRPALTLDESLLILPGLFLQNPNNFAQDVRLSIRGFGARSPFGVRGIKILVDGIPQTLPDGISQLDAVDPGVIDRMVVLRGPSASLYGNASGGVISITTENGPESEFESVPRIVMGSYGLFKSQIKLGGRNGSTGYRVFGSRLEYDGYRHHSVTENNLLQTKVDWQNSSGSQIQWTAHKFYSPRAQDPGGLTAAQVDVNPRQAHPRNILFDAGEEVDQEMMGLRWQKSVASRQELSFTTHVIHREFSNRLPFVSGGQVTFDRWSPGVGLKYINDHPWFQKNNRMIGGVEFLYQNDDRQRFDNNSGVRGAQTLNQTENVDSLGVYLRNETIVSEDWELTTGGRYDRIHYRVTDSYTADGDQTGSQTFDQGSGTLGILFHPAEEHRVYLNGSTVYETPTTTELINNPDGTGGFNISLQPQTSYSLELGFKGTPGIEYELALFYIRTQDEITSYELAAFPGRTFFRNAGTSERKGIEGWLRWRPSPQWQATVSYTYSDFEFRDFTSGGQSFKGNRLPGIPVHRAAGRVRYQHPEGMFASLEVGQVSSFYVNNENTAQNNSYTTSRMEMGVEERWDVFLGSLFVGVNNVLDEQYNANTRINAANDRYFEPAPPINWFAGVSVRWVPFN